jgi:hypothetical protein
MSSKAILGNNLPTDAMQHGTICLVLITVFDLKNDHHLIVCEHSGIVCQISWVH